MIVRLVLAGLALGLVVQPALATGTITCTDPGGDAGIELSVGTLSVLAILGATIKVDGRTWSTAPERIPGTPIAVGQGFETAENLSASFTDEAINEIIAELRLTKASEGSDFAMAGTLHMPGIGAYAMVCEGP